MYESLTEFERALARFGDKVDSLPDLKSPIKSLQKMLIQQIKELYKELKTLRKEEKSEWETPN
jgi:vacuolar-type H+-ATPase subunit I/STV1